MEKQNADHKLSSLSAGSKRNLQQYCKNLSSNSDEDLFDDQAYEVTERYARDEKRLHQVKSHLEKVHFSQSRRKYSQIEMQLQRFTLKDYTSFRWCKHYQTVKEELKIYFQQFHLKPLKYRNDEDIEEALPKLRTHSGWTYIETGFRKKGENLVDCLRRYKKEMKEAIQAGSFNKPILCGIRTQCGMEWIDETTNELIDKEPTHKTRLVSMIDLWLIICELQWAKPFQDAMRHVPWYSGGKSDSEIQRRLSHLRGKYTKWISLDYSKYDQSISSWLIEDAFEIVEAAFDNMEDIELWEVMKKDLIKKAFVNGKGEIVYSSRGVPSGSMWTQVIDSIVNMLMIATYCESKGFNFDCNIMGDDNLIFTSAERFTKGDVCSYISKNFGIEANEEKADDGDKYESPHYLSRFWTWQGIWRHPDVLLAKICFPEKYRNYRRTDLTPEIVIHSYILAYPLGMRELIDVPKFQRENPISKKDLLKCSPQVLTGYFKYQLEYGNVSLHQNFAS